MPSMQVRVQMEKRLGALEADKAAATSLVGLFPTASAPSQVSAGLLI